MRDSLRESLSYFGLYRKMFKAKKVTEAQKVCFGADKEQHFLYYAPLDVKSDKIIVWIHGGGWNAGSPEFFDFVGQCIAGAGYHFISLGYRLSPKNKYPCQIEDVCKGYNAVMQFLQGKGIDTTKIVVSGPSAGAHLASILCYSKRIQSEHDGLIEYSCAEKLYEKAMQIGNECELYSVIDKKNTHSWYTAGMFLKTRKENYGLDKFFSWIEAL